MTSALLHLYRSLLRDRILLALLIFAAAYFALYYFTDPIRPTATWKGWWLHFDQGSYLTLAQSIADFRLGQPPSSFSFGVGYPLVAVPALWLGFERDPFVFFNFIAFVFTVFATYRAAKHFISPLGGFLAGFGLLFATPLIVYTIEPWNSTVSLFSISGLLLIATSKKITRWHALAAGLLVGWAFAARYIDVVWLGAIAVACLYRGSLKDLAQKTIFLTLGVILWIGPVLYAHYKIFGSPFRTPYVMHVGIGGGPSDQQAGAYDPKRIPNAALGMFVSPRLAGSPDPERGLLINMFWSLAAIPGGFILLIKRKKHRLFFLTLISATAIAFLFYLSFRASTPSSLKFGVLHYFKMFWPGIVILAVAFFDYLFNDTVAKQTTRKRPKVVTAKS